MVLANTKIVVRLNPDTHLMEMTWTYYDLSTGVPVFANAEEGQSVMESVQEFIDRFALLHTDLVEATQVRVRNLASVRTL